jgi:hypothetical protein
VTVLPAGTYSPHVTDGYWLMLAPLSAGKHTISVHLVPDFNYGIEQQITYHLTISGRRP